MTNMQFGFTKGQSTETALLTQKEIILDSFERQLCTLGIFVDYSKAFDSINHTTLLEKLNYYGFRGVFLKLMESYLQHRMQQVVINSHTSDLKPLDGGVPQGSILGPLLFCIYINDLVSIDNDVKFIVYADDTTILVTAKDAEHIMIKANKVLLKLSSWSNVNSLTINVNKTKAVLFRPKNRNIDTCITLQLNNSILPIVPSFRCLGVVFEHHVEMLMGKLSRVTMQIAFFPSRKY